VFLARYALAGATLELVLALLIVESLLGRDLIPDGEHRLMHATRKWLKDNHCPQAPQANDRGASLCLPSSRPGSAVNSGRASSTWPAGPNPFEFGSQLLRRTRTIAGYPGAQAPTTPHGG
jgi:hypothetical protein